MGVACSTSQPSSPELRHVQVKEAAQTAALKAREQHLQLQLHLQAAVAPTEHSHSHDPHGHEHEHEQHTSADQHMYSASFGHTQHKQQQQQRNDLKHKQHGSAKTKQEENAQQHNQQQQQTQAHTQQQAHAHSNLLVPPSFAHRQRCASETFISTNGSSSLLPSTTAASSAAVPSDGQGKAVVVPTVAPHSQMHLSLPHLSSPSTSCTTAMASARSMVESMMASPPMAKIGDQVAAAHHANNNGNRMSGGGVGGFVLSRRCSALPDAIQGASMMATGLSLLSSPMLQSAPLSPRSAGAALALAAASAVESSGSSLCLSNLSLAEGGVVPALLLPWAVQQQRARALERGMEDLLSHPPLFLSLAEQPAGPGANPPNPPTRVQPIPVPSWSPFNSPRLAPGQQAPMLRRKLNTLALKHVQMVLEGMSAAQVVTLSCHTRAQAPNFLTALNNPGASATLAQRLRPPTGVQATPTGSPISFATLPPAALGAATPAAAAAVESQMMGSMSPIATPASLMTAPNSVVLAACVSPNGPSGVPLAPLDIASSAAPAAAVSLSGPYAPHQSAPLSENLAQLEYRLALLVAKSEWKAARISQPPPKTSLFARDAYKFQGLSADLVPRTPLPDEHVEIATGLGKNSIFGFMRSINTNPVAVAVQQQQQQFSRASTVCLSAPGSALLCSVTASASPLTSPISSRASPTTPAGAQDTANFLSSAAHTATAGAAAASASTVAAAAVAAATSVRCGRRSAPPQHPPPSLDVVAPAVVGASGAVGRRRRHSVTAHHPSLSLSRHSPECDDASRIHVQVAGDSSDEESSPEVGRRQSLRTGTPPPERAALVVPARTPSSTRRQTHSALGNDADGAAMASLVAAQQEKREQLLLLAHAPHVAASGLPGQADDSTTAHAPIVRVDV